GRLNQARAVLKKGLDQHPGHPSLFEALARVELKAGQPAQAVHWLMQELMLRPDNLALRFQVFDLSLGLGAPGPAEKALAALKKAEGDAGYLWRYAEAAFLVNFADSADVAKLELAHQRLAEAKKQQPAWNQPLILEGFLEERAGHADKAVTLYQD